MANNPLTNPIVMDPVPRIEGHLGVEIETDAIWAPSGHGHSAGTVTEVNCKAEMFRGFENILKGRHPGDALHITQRI